MSGAIESNLSSLLEAERKVLVIMEAGRGRSPSAHPSLTVEGPLPEEACSGSI